MIKAKAGEVKYEHSFDPSFDERDSRLCLYFGSLTKKGTNDLSLTPLLMYAKEGIKYPNGFDMHMIPVKGNFKHDNNFDSTFDAFKGVQTHRGFGYCLIS